MNIDNKIEKWYESKIVFMISVLTPVIVILGFIYSMKTDIALARQDIASIKDLMQDVNAKNVAQDTIEQNLNNRVTIIETKMR